MESTHQLETKKLLHGEYEYNGFTSEELRERSVPDYSYNILNKEQKLYTPIVDYSRSSRPRWPNNADFAVCLTHDMDHVSKYSVRHSLRSGFLRARMRWISDSKEGYLSETGLIPSFKSVAGTFIDSIKDATQLEQILSTGMRNGLN